MSIVICAMGMLYVRNNSLIYLTYALLCLSIDCGLIFSCEARVLGIVGENPPGDDDALTRARVEGRLRGGMPDAPEDI